MPEWRQNRKRAGKRLRAIREAGGLNPDPAGRCQRSDARGDLAAGDRKVLAARRDGAQAGGSPGRGPGAVHRSRQNHRADAADGGRGRLPARGASGPGADVAAQGQVSGTKVSGEWRVPSVVIAAGPQRATARPLRPSRPALPRLKRRSSSVGRGCWSVSGALTRHEPRASEPASSRGATTNRFQDSAVPFFTAANGPRDTGWNREPLTMPRWWAMIPRAEAVPVNGC